MRIFARLIGLETEYALRCRPAPGGTRPSDYRLYAALVAALRRKLPTAAADQSKQGKPGVFLANGGAVWFERCRLAGQTGLVEGCTPECLSPRQLLICQRAQDRLLAETAKEAAEGGEFCLLKNCRDSRGQSYGAQENYEAVLARGWRLAVWRAAWVVLYPLAGALFLALVLLLGALLLVNYFLVGSFYSLACRWDPRWRDWRGHLFGWHWLTENEADAVWPNWLEAPIVLLVKITLMPFCLLLSGLLAVTDLRRTQRRLLGFLVSRAVLGGSGWLDARGRFHLAEKAESRRVVWTEIVPDSSRPVFSLGHICKLVFAVPLRWRELLAPRQRLQISLGDSNLCEEAEYLRVATTLLVLDAIEAGAITETPVPRWPLRALRQVSRDPTLTVSVAIRGGRRMTALEIQHWYLDACRRFVEGVADAPEEAWDVLRRWADVLDRLETDRSSLVGRLDWVTKQFLLDQAGAGLPAAARKKIDLRYHELSAEGYFARLWAVGLAASVATDAEIEQAQRLPPPGSPAGRRAHYIREFSGTNTVLKVSWRFLEIFADGRRTTIDLHDAAP
jgi:proteasome accessory factor A